MPDEPSEPWPASPTGDYHPTSDDPLPPPRRTREKPGDVIGPYKLLRKLGEGGMGAVWHAEQTQPVRRQVAIKLVRPDLAADHFLARFEAERQALALMDHPNIAKVFDAGTTETGAPYFVMELVKGIPFTKYCDDAKLTIRERVQLFVPVCRAVQHAHTKGIIHRDLKPTNILVAIYDGVAVPKIIDFGIAKALHQKLTEKTLVTEFGAIIGTPEYMAPEQAELNALDVDTRADVYSLGVVLYETLAGAMPFDRKKLQGHVLLELLRLIKETEPVAPSKKLSSVHTLPEIAAKRKTDALKLPKLIRGELDWVVMKALEKERGRRYTTADLFAADLEHYLADEPVQAGPPSTSYRLWKTARKHRGRIVAAGLLLLTLVGGLVAASAQAYRATNAERRLEKSLASESAQRQLAEEQRVRADGAAAQALVERDKAEAEAYAANLQVAINSIDANEMRRVRPALDACPPRLKRWEWRHLENRSDMSLKVLFSTKALIHGIDYDAKSNRIALCGNVATSSVIDGSSGKWVLDLKGHTHMVHSISFSPAGDRLATMSHDETVRIWNAHTGVGVAVLPGHKSGGGSVSFHPSRNRVATQDSEAVRIWDTESGGELNAIRLAGAKLKNVRFSPDGDHLLVAVDKSAVIFDATSGRQLIALDAQESDVTKASYSPNGRLIATGTLSGSVRIWDATNGKLKFPLGVHGGTVTSVTFSPDSDRLVTTSFDRTSAVWNCVTGSVQTLLKGHAEYVFGAVFLPGGDRFATASNDGTVRVWDIDTEMTPKTLTNVFLSPPKSLRCSGGIIAIGGPSASTRIMDVLSGKDIAVLHAHRGTLVQCDLSQDGKRVLTVGDDGNAYAWDAMRGVSAAKFVDQGNGVRSGCISPDGRRIALVRSDHSVITWDLERNQQLARFLGHSDVVNSAIFDAAGSRLLTCSNDGTAKVWTADTAQELVVFDARKGMVTNGIFDPTGTKAATAYKDFSARLWDVSTGIEQAVLAGHESSIVGLAYAHNGGRLITSSADRTARVWEAETGQSVSVLRGHHETVSAAAFDPTGDRIVTGAWDGTARIWETTTGRELVTLRGHQHWVTSVLFDQAGESLMTASADGTARIWHSRPYRERYPAIAAARAAFKTMTERLTPRFKAGEDLDAIVQSLVDDKSLDETHRRMGLAVVCEERERRWEKEKTK